MRRYYCSVGRLVGDSEGSHAKRAAPFHFRPPVSMRLAAGGFGIWRCGDENEMARSSNRSREDGDNCTTNCESMSCTWQLWSLDP